MPKEYVELSTKKKKKTMWKSDRQRIRKERRAQTQRNLRKEYDRMKRSERHVITQEMLEKIADNVNNLAVGLFSQHCKDVPHGITSQLLSQEDMSPSTSLQNLLPLESVCDSQMISMTMVDEMLPEDPDFVCFFWLKMKKILEKRNMRLNPYNFQQLIRMMLSICQKHWYGQETAHDQQNSHEMQWKILQSLDMVIDLNEIVHFRFITQS